MGQAGSAGWSDIGPALLRKVQKAVGQGVSLDTICKLLERHGWRMTGHVKTSQEAQEDFRKLSILIQAALGGGWGGGLSGSRFLRRSGSLLCHPTARNSIQW